MDYDRFLGGWIGAALGSALGRFTEGQSPQWVEDQYPRGLRRFPEESRPGADAILAYDTSDVISSRREFPRAVGSIANPYSAFLRVLPAGLAAAAAGLTEAELDDIAVEAMLQDREPKPAAAILGALLYARLLRQLVLGMPADEEIDQCLFGPIEHIERPSPALVLTEPGETQTEAWGVARITVTEGVGAGLRSLERFDFLDDLLDPNLLAMAVVAWALTTDKAVDRGLEYLIARGGSASDLGMIGGAVIGARDGFKDIPQGFLRGLSELPSMVEAGNRLFKAAEDYRR